MTGNKGGNLANPGLPGKWPLKRFLCL